MKQQTETPQSVQNVAKNTMKNAGLIILALLLAALSAATWFNGLQISQMPADSWPRRVYEQLFGGAIGYELRSSGVAAAMPVQIVVSVGGQPSAVQYNPAEIDAAMELVQPVFASAFAEVDKMEAVQETDLMDALVTGNCILLRYPGALPLPVLAGWLGDGTCESELSAQMLLLCPDENTLYLRTQEGTLYRCTATVEQTALLAAQQSFAGTPCGFAGDSYAVWAETPLFDHEVLSANELKTDLLDLPDVENGADLEMLRAAFGYTSYTDSYLEKEGQVQVVVDESTTLRLSEQGDIHYENSGAGNGITAFDSGEATGWSALNAQIDCARTLLDMVLRSADTGTRASLYAVQQSQGITTLTFFQSYAGIPILEQTDFATFVFRGETLARAEIHLQRFSVVGQKQTVLPAKQAAAGATQGQTQLFAAYLEQEDVFFPQRVFLQIKTK